MLFRSLLQNSLFLMYPISQEIFCVFLSPFAYDKSMNLLFLSFQNCAFFFSDVCAKQKVLVIFEFLRRVSDIGVTLIILWVERCWELFLLHQKFRCVYEG